MSTATEAGHFRHFLPDGPKAGVAVEQVTLLGSPKKKKEKKKGLSTSLTI